MSADLFNYNIKTQKRLLMLMRCFLHSLYLLSLLPLSTAGPPPNATVAQGVLQGVYEGSVAAFRGIPFAKPPVGHLRWRPPEAP